MSLRLRLALTFAIVALVTGLAVALTAPTIVGRGFARLQLDDGTPGAGQGQGQGPGSGGAGAGMGSGHTQAVQQEITQTIVVVALLAAAGASVLGFVIAGRIAAPLGRVSAAASALAGGDLSQRSGIGDRPDEIGAVGRAFDSMAADLERADASRRRFFQDAAHELKTPLAVIDATATAVLDGVYTHDDQHLRTIREQSRVLAGVVDAVRTISLAESGALPMRQEPVDAAQVVSDAVRTFAARAELAGIMLAGRAAAPLVVTGDRDRIGQVVAAFADNALRHTPRGGRVEVRGERRADRVRIVVADTGPGMPPDVAARVFDPFYQQDEARDRATGASGLGLAIARALSEALGGSVGVDSVEGAGSTFWLELPAAEA